MSVESSPLPLAETWLLCEDGQLMQKPEEEDENSGGATKDAGIRVAMVSFLTVILFLTFLFY